ncbi:hypothetical protein D9V84_08460 [Bacteroidetes/Chlorobi group bacterium Naka2016]|jgi:hypothetical protein|nr:MAG: hypothetical protein D9V84_08460 [Bacteroidetes/Chlorobi group bacterium Naka2016]
MDIRGVEFSNSSSTYYQMEGSVEKNIFSENKNNNQLIFKTKDTLQLNQSSQGEQKAEKFGKKELSPEEQKRVEELKRIDAKVRAHEMAHLAAGGGLVRGGANYTYEIGPDGKQYAVGGEVKIDMSVNPDDPEGAIQKMQQVRRAALAPADPSPQDRSVAQQASNIEAQMRAKLTEEKTKPQNKLTKVYKSYLENQEPNYSKEISKRNEMIATPSIQSLKRKVNTII